MSYDSLFAYEQGREGVVTMLWPPMHAYMFRLSDRLGAGPGGVFLAQTFGLFLGASLSLNMLIGRRLVAGLAFLAFTASFLYAPGQLGVLICNWRDVTTASCALLALAFWLLAVRHRAGWLLVMAIGLAGCAVALRYNAFVLVAPLLLLMIWSPFGDGGAKGRTTALAATAASLALAWASTHWRAPDLVALPPPQTFSAVQEFDLIGISACADKNYLTPGMTEGQAITPYQIRKHYDPRHLLLTLADKPGLPRLIETDDEGAVGRQWAKVAPKEFGCYLAHRALVFTEQMGMARAGLFYPVHSGLDANRFGLKLARPAAAKRISDYVNGHAGALWRRPFLLYIAATLAAGLALAARLPRRLTILALLAGAYAYPALLFLAAPAADARYIFPSNVLCALVVCVVAGQLLSARAGAPQAFANTEP
jgi:hypothetical protein